MKYAKWGLCLALAITLQAQTAAASDRMPSKQAVSFQARDGHRIFADYYAPKSQTPAPPAPMVILLHMYRSDRTAWEPLIGPLHEAGFATLAIDLRGHGESATTASTKRVQERDPAIFREMQEDVRAAYDWLARQPNVDRARFGLVGASVGCSIAIQYAGYDRSVDAVVCLSPGLNYLGLNSEQDMRQVTGRRLLLVATAHEREAPERLAAIGSGAEARIEPGRYHGTRMFGQVSAAIPATVSFLRQHVGPATDTDRVVFASVRKTIYHLPGSAWIPRISVENLRHFSSSEEAELRGMRKARSRGPRDADQGGSGRR